MRRLTPILTLLIIAPAFLFFSCGARKKGKQSQSPAETIKTVYMAANGGWYSETEPYIYSEVLNSIKQNLGTLHLIKEWDNYTRNGKIEKIEILNEIIRGERAEVYFKVYFKGGETKQDQDLLINENRQWKILFDFVN
ncbi:MAG: DUF4878 domain-containing protein [Candidatus Aminicenantes bacterium]